MKRASLLLALLFPSVGLRAQANFIDMAEAYGADVIQGYGTSIIDFNGDGLVDLFLTRRDATNCLFENKGGGVFEEVSEASKVDYLGASYQASWADIDNDGDLDFYVGTGENQFNLLYENQGDGTFEEIGRRAGVAVRELTLSNMFADVDGDGLVDLYVAIPHRENKLFRNNGDGTFTDIIQQAGARDVLIAMGAGFFDYDNDGDQDLYLSHDTNQANILYENDGTGKFRDVSSEAGVDYVGQAMGVDFADFNNDGWQDIYITNLFENVLFQNNGDGTFTNISKEAGVDDYGMGWGVTWLDFNNDGWQDLYVANNTYFSPYDNVLYRNNGDNTFSIASENSIVASPIGGFGVASGDINQDGQADIFLGNVVDGDLSEVFINERKNGNYISLRLEGRVSNRSAIGARVEVRAGDLLLTKEVRSGSGYAAQNSLELHFGLGENEQVDELRVYWPSGIVDFEDALDVNKRYDLLENGDIREIGLVTSIDESHTEQNFGFRVQGNPLRTASKMLINLNKTTYVEINMFNVLGEPIQTLVAETMLAGEHEIAWQDTFSPKNLQSGIYLLKLQVEGRTVTRKVLKID